MSKESSLQENPDQFSSRPEMNLPIGYVGLFAGRLADKDGNYWHEGFVIRGEVDWFSDNHILKSVKVLKPSKRIFPWRSIMLDNLFEILDENVSPGKISRDKQNSLCLRSKLNQHPTG
jgi:hypothetical protein